MGTDIERNRAYFSSTAIVLTISKCFPVELQEEPHVYHKKVEVYRIKASVFVNFLSRP